MLGIFPSFSARTESLYQNHRATLPNTFATTNGLLVGQDVARRFLEARNSDGTATTLPYIPKTTPGEWRRTPPFFRPPLDPHWRSLKVFAIPDVNSFLPPPPPILSSEEYAKDFNEVKVLGSKTSSVRTAEQTETAFFWSDFSYTAMPPGHWHEIAANIVENRQTPVMDTARLFALLSMAQADAAIVCWEAKYRYNFWRPITAIRRADEDGNPATEKDATWNSLLPSPNFPENSSGHSTFSKASAQVLTYFYGTDAVAFTAKSDALPKITRTFTSLSACANEIGMSRIYGGIHFQCANVEGKKCGGMIADYICEHFLLPVDSAHQEHDAGSRTPEIPK